MFKLSFAIIAIFFILSCNKDPEDQIIVNRPGSYSTMLSIGNFLYIVNRTHIRTYRINNVKEPVLIDTQLAGFDISSLYHYQDLLLFGSADQMYIYRIETNGIPSRTSSSSYLDAFGEVICTSDPIVAHDHIAYVTLSTLDNECAVNRLLNELRVYDIKNITAPKLLQTIQMENPKGLALANEHLFVCDNNAGLAVFDIKEKENPVLVKRLGGFQAYDVIVKDHLLIVASKDHLRQYDISDETDIKFVSKIDF